MGVFAGRRAAKLASTCAVAVLVFGSATSWAQDDGGDEADGVVAKTEAILTPPEGTEDTRAKGKAKTLSVDNGQNTLQKLAITAQHLERGVEYRVVADGFELGVFRTRGNSGTLVLRFRDPARGNQTALPEEVMPVEDIQTVEIYDEESGELVLTGTLENADDGDTADTGGDGGDGDDGGDAGGDDSGDTGGSGDGSGGNGGGNGHGNGGGQGHGNGGGNGGGNGNGNGGGNGHGNGGGNGNGNGNGGNH